MSSGLGATDFRRALPLLPRAAVVGAGAVGGPGALHAEEAPRDPFAPPPKDAPDRPWQPRRPAAGAPAATEDGPHAEQPPRPQVPPPHPWSPGWQDGRLDRTPGQGPQGPFGPQRPLPPPNGPQQRFDPGDPAQRRARYAVLSGTWGIFFFILGVPYVTLLLAALALYWSISALRGGPRGAQDAKDSKDAKGAGGTSAGAARTGGTSAARRPGASGPGWGTPYGPAQAPVRPQAPAALGGLLAAFVGLAMVGANFAVHLVYRPYFDCVQDALTQQARTSCTSLLPEQLRGYFSAAAAA